MQWLESARADLHRIRKERRGTFYPDKSSRAYRIYAWWKQQAKKPPEAVGKCRYHVIIVWTVLVAWPRAQVFAALKKPLVRAMLFFAVVATIATLAIMGASPIRLVTNIIIALGLVAYLMGGVMYTWMLYCRVWNHEWALDVPAADDPEMTRELFALALGVIFLPFTILVFFVWSCKEINARINLGKIAWVVAGLVALGFLTIYIISFVQSPHYMLIATCVALLTVAVVVCLFTAISNLDDKARRRKREAMADLKRQQVRNFYDGAEMTEIFHKVFSYHHPSKSFDSDDYRKWRRRYQRAIEERVPEPQYLFLLPYELYLPFDLIIEINSLRVKAREKYERGGYAPAPAPPRRHPFKAFFGGIWGLVCFVYEAVQTWRMGYCPLMIEDEPPAAERTR